MKKCSKCKIEKETIDFHKKTSSKDGLQSACKQCHKKHNQKYNQSFARRGVIAYNNLKRRVRPGQHQSQYCHDKGIECNTTREEFGGFWYSNKSIIEEIIEEGGTPSVDRIDSDDNYCLSNMRILSHRDNCSHKEQCYSKTKGVTFDKSRGKWLAQVRHSGKRHFLGYYATEAEAVKAVELDRKNRESR